MYVTETPKIPEIKNALGMSFFSSKYFKNKVMAPTSKVAIKIPVRKPTLKSSIIALDSFSRPLTALRIRSFIKKYPIKWMLVNIRTELIGLTYMEGNLI